MRCTTLSINKYTHRSKKNPKKSQFFSSERLYNENGHYSLSYLSFFLFICLYISRTAAKGGKTFYFIGQVWLPYDQ